MKLWPQIVLESGFQEWVVHRYCNLIIYNNKLFTNKQIDLQDLK